MEVQKKPADLELNKVYTLNNWGLRVFGDAVRYEMRLAKGEEIEFEIADNKIVYLGVKSENTVTISVAIRIADPDRSIFQRLNTGRNIDKYQHLSDLGITTRTFTFNFLDKGNGNSLKQKLELYSPW